MILLNDVDNPESESSKLRMDVIPAPLHDYSGQVYKDVLYSIYTVSTTLDNTEIDTSVIARDLVKHTGVSGISGYWVGIGINKEILDGATYYKGFGDPIDTNLGDPIQIELEVVEDEQNYGCFYFDCSSSLNTDNKAYIVVIDENNIHYHYNIDLSQISKTEAEEELEPITWSDVNTTEMIDDYLFGINLADQQGNPLPESLFRHYLNSAIEYFENLLDITIKDLDCPSERHDYIRNDYQNWGYMQLDHNPVKEITGLRLMYGSKPSVEIPLDWIQLDKLTGQVTLFPSAGSAGSLIIGQTGMLFGFQGYWDYAPQLWEVDYTAGIDSKNKTMPVTLLKEAIYKRACCGILNVWGDLIIGAGIASQSVSIDGVSQSISTTQSAMFGGASARVQNYTDDIKDTLLPALRQKFGGIRMVVV